MRVVVAVAVGLGGCHREETGSEDSGDDGVDGACGEVGAIPSVTLTGWVRDEAANRVAGVDLQFEEWNWNPGRIYGTATTDAEGGYSITVANLPVVEDCWGSAVQYWLTGVKDELSGEQPLNPYMIEVYEDGLDAISTGDVPMILRPAR